MQRIHISNLMRPHLYLIIIFVLLGCRRNENTDPKTEDNNGSGSSEPNGNYVLTDPSTDVNTICPEYPHYKIIYAKEAADFSIWVYGNRLTTNNGQVWASDGLYVRNWASINSPSSFVDGSRYTAKVGSIPINSSAWSDSYTFTLNLGSADWNDGNPIYNSVATSNFTVECITSRNYTIDYSYQAGCDLFNATNSSSMKIRMDKAFTEAGTTIIINNEKSGNLSQKPILWVSDPPYNHPGDGLFLYVKDSIASNNWANKSRLIAIYDVLGDDLGQGHTGITFTDISDYDGHFLFANSFIFVNRCLYDPIWNGKDLVAETTIHELGHLRGREDKITDNDTHNTKHNGNNKDVCVMHSGNDPNLSQENWLKMLNKPTFCEGHKQFLLNKTE